MISLKRGGPLLMQAATVPPAVQEYFEREKRAQASHIKVAEAKRNVRQTLALVETSLLPKLGERNQHIDLVLDQAEDLEDSSYVFLSATQPKWRQWLKTWTPPMWWWPSWMFQWCGCLCNLMYRRRR